MENLTYEEAYKELKMIAAEIENETVSIDVLSEKVKRASSLIQYCQEKLRSTESEVNKIIKQMDAKPRPDEL
ncbi:MAG: exodeoxyribonuclease VII small subunit [Cyclobacteriaceae bacterium]|nr:exodeoxyribonuclease VII small subunit [Cyclobacteriaceae bacterium SS2]|tara:strand:+ start:429 stop:644 length:216 start_codon:yes stop_codon:yes gene_type:complete